MVFGDSTGGEEVFKELIRQVNLDPDLSFAVNLGDFVYSGGRAEYQQYLKLAAGFKIKLCHVPGNHEVVNAGRINFQKFIGPVFYSFNYQGAHFVVLDNSFYNRFTEQQFNWLAQDLKKYVNSPTFIFMHRPVWDPSGILSYYVMPEEKGGRLMRLFEKHGVKIVFAGHLHGYAAGEKSGVRYVTTAGAGSPMVLPEFLGGYYNYVRVDVDGDNVTCKVRRLFQ